jgi:hypothetical protein
MNTIEINAVVKNAAGEIIGTFTLPVINNVADLNMVAPALHTMLSVFVPVAAVNAQVENHSPVV